MTQEFVAPQMNDSQTWIPYSGASHHITVDANNMAQNASYLGSEQVHMGDGQGVPITSIGSARFISPNNSQITLTLNNLLQAPHITKNLVSISQFAKDNHVYFEFHPHVCYVKSQVSNQVLLKGTIRSDGLYSFKDIQIIQSSSSKSYSHVNNSIAINTTTVPIKPI